MIELEGVPELVDPVMIAAFEGWNDAGDAATASVEHLQSAWDATFLGEMDPEDYYDFQVNRPSVSIGPDDERRIAWPTTTVSHVKVPGTGRDLLLVRGVEPNMRWRSYCEELLTVARDLNVSMLVTIGALLADSPHTRPIPVTSTSTDAELTERLHLEESRYEGPTGIVGVLQDAFGSVGIPGMSIWAAVPHYVAQPPSPKATLALLQRVEDLLDLTIPMGELPDDARAWERGVDELAAEDSEVAEYVQALEEAKDTADLPEASGEAIAREFERYLRRRDQGRGPRSQ